jgi:hypothetical protein
MGAVMFPFQLIRGLASPFLPAKFSTIPTWTILHKYVIYFYPSVDSA